MLSFVAAGCEDERPPSLSRGVDAGAPAADAGRDDASIRPSCALGEPRCIACPGFSPSILALRWPLEGIRGSDWAITNYLDLDPMVDGLRDHHGATGDQAKTYDGHRGLDIVIPNFRAMEEGVSVRAVAEGWVERILDGQPDRNTDFSPACTRTGNQVQIRHPSGYVHFYTHFRKDSIRVTEGEFVEEGRVLGEVGSSGCSSWPHLHLELRDCVGAPVETLLTEYWVDPPAYEESLGLLDVVVREGGFDDDARMQILDPAANPTSHRAGAMLGVAVILGEGRPGDTLEVLVRSSEGDPAHHLEYVLESTKRLSYRYWNRVLDGPPGRWTLELMINGDPVRTLPLDLFTD